MLNKNVHTVYGKICYSSEWFSSSGLEQVEGPCIEKNFCNDENPVEYKCEVWILVKRKSIKG